MLQKSVQKVSKEFICKQLTPASLAAPVTVKNFAISPPVSCSFFPRPSVGSPWPQRV